jgi:competence protein ComEC
LGNESGICVLFQTENCDILITGDRGELGEMLLLQQRSLPELEVLVAGHHGSAGSTSERLLAHTNPETVVISVGENNSYGHPAEAMLERLKVTGCEIFRTDLDGTILYRR